MAPGKEEKNKRQSTQNTLARLNFTKKLKTVSGEYVEVALPQYFDEELKTLKCPQC